MNKTFITTILLSTILFPLSTVSVQAATVMAVSYGTITGVNQQARDTSWGGDRRRTPGWYCGSRLG